MAEYQKHEQLGGSWVKGKEVRSGSQAKIKSEIHPSASQFKDKEGNIIMQDIGKIHINGEKEIKNIRVNRASISALVDAFGTNSANWIDKLLTVETMKVSVGGKMQTALYLIPEGYSLDEDDNGYVVITNKEKVLMGDETMGDETVDASDDIESDEIAF